MSQDMPLLKHLEELRNRVIFCACFVAVLTVFSYAFYELITPMVLQPFLPSVTNGASININTIYEGFLVKLKLSLLFGFVFSLPIIVFQLCRFIIPGLKKGEKKWLLVVIFFSSASGIASTYLGYAVVFPHVVSFLLNASFIPKNIHVLLNYQENVSAMIGFLIGGILVFQSPIVLTILLAKNAVSRSFLTRHARWFLVGIIICSAIVTPPDIISQLSLAVPLIACYFGCILLAKIMNWGQEC